MTSQALAPVIALLFLGRGRLGPLTGIARNATALPEDVHLQMSIFNWSGARFVPRLADGSLWLHIHRGGAPARASRNG